MELRGSIQAVRQMEEVLRVSWGVELFEDTGTAGFWPLRGNNHHPPRSQAYQRIYHVPLKEGPRVFIPWAVVRFWYDERVGRASVHIPERSVRALTERGILAQSGQEV